MTGDHLLPGSPPASVFVWVVVRVVVSAGLLLLAYFLVPFDGLADVSPFVSLPLALLLFSAYLVVELRRIIGAPYPGLRALEALAVLVPLFLIIFAAAYYLMGLNDPTWFSEPLSRLDALYFTVTVFATVGFGDVTATTTVTRSIVTIQMVLDLILLGFGLRVILGAVKEARRRANLPDDL